MIGLPGTALGKRSGQNGLLQDIVTAFAEKRTQHRPQENQTADQCRNRVARKAEHPRGAEPSCEHRFSRPHGHFGKVEHEASIGEGPGNQIAVTDRGPADRDEDIGVGAPRDGVCKRLRLVRCNPKIDRLTARRIDKGSDAVADGRHDLVGTKRAPGGTISSPVERIATRGFLRTGSSA